MTEKYIPDRQKRPFQEHMATLYQNIDTLVYAAEIACHNDETGAGCYCGCPFYSQVFHRDEPYEDDCNLPKIRKLIGDRTEQHDIPEAELSK